MNIYGLTGNIDRLITDYYQRSGDTEKTVGALLYSLGEEQTEQMLGKANGRLIELEYGEGEDNLTKIHFINNSQKETLNLD